DPAGEAPDRLQPDRGGLGVTAAVGLHELPRVAETPARPLGHRAVADRSLETAGHAGHVGRAVGVEAEVTQVAAPADVAGEEATSAQHRAADPRAEGQENDVATAGGGAFPGLA